MKKYTSIVFVLLAFFASTVAYGQNPQIEGVKYFVNEMNKVCPLNFGTGGTMTAVKFNDNAKGIMFYYTLNEDEVNIDEFNKGKQQARQALIYAFFEGESRWMFEKIAEANVGIKVIYKGDTSGKSCSFTFTAEEIQQIMNQPLSDHEALEKLYVSQLSMENERCPQEIEEGMVMTRAVQEGVYSVYHVEVNEDVYDMDVIKSPDVALAMKLGMKETFTDPSIKQNLHVLNALNKGLIYRFVGSKTGKMMEVKFTSQELKGVNTDIKLEDLK